MVKCNCLYTIEKKRKEQKIGRAEKSLTKFQLLYSPHTTLLMIRVNWKPVKQKITNCCGFPAFHTSFILDVSWFKLCAIGELLIVTDSDWDRAKLANKSAHTHSSICFGEDFLVCCSQWYWHYVLECFPRNESSWLSFFLVSASFRSYHFLWRDMYILKIETWDYNRLVILHHGLWTKPVHFRENLSWISLYMILLSYYTIKEHPIKS